jgi:hypothetical protein
VGLPGRRDEEGEVMALGPYTQICYVSLDLQRSIDRWILAGAGPFYTGDSSALPQNRTYRGEPATDRFRAAIAFLGSTQIEIVQPLDDGPSFYREVLERDSADGGDEVLHHVQPKARAMSLDAFDAECARLERDGFICVATLTSPGGGTVRYYEDPARQLGFFIEMSHKDERMFALMEKMFAQHLAWDGKDPVREMRSLSSS